MIHNRWFCQDMSIKAFYIVIWSFAALNCANMCLPMCGLLNMWAIEQSVKWWQIQNLNHPSDVGMGVGDSYSIFVDTTSCPSIVFSLEIANLRWIVFLRLIKSSPQETVDKAQHGDVFQLQHVKSAHSGLLVVCWAPAFNFVNKHLLLGTMEVFVLNMNHFIGTLTLTHVEQGIWLREFNCAAFEILEKLKQIYTVY